VKEREKRNSFFIGVRRQTELLLVRKKEAMSLSVRGTFSLEKEKASVFIILHIGNFLFSAILFDDVKEKNRVFKVSMRCILQNNLLA